MPQFLSEDDDAGKVLIAGADASGRIDAWLAQVLDGSMSRSRVKSLVKDGEVTINGEPVKAPHQKVQPGDRIAITIPEPEDPEPKGEDIPLDVLYEDDDLIVIVKPAGLVVHPAAGNWTGTLVNAMIHHCGASLSGIGGVKRPGIVHRLDKETSGVMVVAKNDMAHASLSAQFADHGKTMKLERAYQAIVWGLPRPQKGTINAPLGRSSDRVKRAVVSAGAEDARHAVTHYDVLERYHERPDGTAIAARIACRLETGRTHQIRVHMAHVGHPLIGDPDYGLAFRTKVNLLPKDVQPVVNRFRRQALHAYLLQIEHPRTGDVMRFESQLPADLMELIDGLRIAV
ncbi:RluA family pseudouridine synthase [Rhizobium sp.]